MLDQQKDLAKKIATILQEYECQTGEIVAASLVVYVPDGEYGEEAEQVVFNGETFVHNVDWQPGMLSRSE